MPFETPDETHFEGPLRSPHLDEEADREYDKIVDQGLGTPAAAWDKVTKEHGVIDEPKQPEQTNEDSADEVASAHLAKIKEGIDADIAARKVQEAVQEEAKRETTIKLLKQTAPDASDLHLRQPDRSKTLRRIY